MEPSRSSSAAQRLLPAAYLALALAFAAAVSARACLGHLDAPHHDDWFLLDQMYRTPLGDWVFSLQNGHRLPVTLWLLHLDQIWAGGRMWLLVAAAQASAWVFALVLALALRRLDPPLRRTLLGFGIFAFFWSGSAYNFQWGVNQGSVWTAMWLLIAVTALASARERGGASEHAGRVWLAAGAGFVTTFGQGMGPAVWPALGAVWTAAGLSWRSAGVLLAAACASLGLYSVGLFGSNGAPSGPGALFEVIGGYAADLARFVSAFAGAPLGWALRGLGAAEPVQRLGPPTAVGALLVLFALGFVPLARRRKSALPVFALAGFGLMAFVCFGGLLVGITRLLFGGPSQAVELRFLCWSTLLWIGAPLALAGLSTHRRARLALTIALPVLSLAMLPYQFVVRAEQRETERRAADVRLALLLGARPDLLLIDGSRNAPDVIGRVLAVLVRERRSPFDDPRWGLWGSAFRERFEPTPGRPCGSAPELRWRVPGDPIAGTQGRLLASHAPAYVVLVDPEGVIRGLGEERSAPPAAPRGRRWEGVIAGYLPAQGYTAWGVLADGRSACPLGAIGGSARTEGPGS